MKVGDLVRHYDQLYAGIGLVVDVAKHPTCFYGDAHVQYSDITDWIAVEDLEIVNESR